MEWSGVSFSRLTYPCTEAVRGCVDDMIMVVSCGCVAETDLGGFLWSCVVEVRSRFWVVNG